MLYGVISMFLPRVDPQAADGLLASAAAADRISRASRRTARAAAWACGLLGAPATVALVLLGFASSGFWIAALVVGTLSIAYVASTAMLLRADAEHVAPAAVAVADREPFERMQSLHTAHITGISRSLGRAVGIELEQLLDRIERRWAALAAQQRAAQFEEGRQRADYPRTAEQNAQIAWLATRRADLAERTGQLLDISRALPGRIVTLADNPTGRVDPAALRLAMIEAQLRVDDVLAAAPVV